MVRRLTHMLSCKEVTRLLSQAQDRPLALGERVKLRLHLVVCTACTRFARQLAFMRIALARYRT
ncbi:MAG TPA: zf-HC2 domain-containing protein [Casimicrobiaceae bacterium]|nr:zf-HC2 domain-containing protein [Casimicrobiaceae bacterium]